MLKKRVIYPVSVAVFYLGKGDATDGLRMAVGFRDADTIATMVGGLAGAFAGMRGLRREWIAKVEANPEVNYRQLARQLIEVILARAEPSRQDLQPLEAIAGEV